MSLKRIGKFKFDINQKDFSKLKVSLPVLIANNSKNHFLKGFRRGAGRGGGFTDASRGGWEKRQRESRISGRKNILVGRSHLRGFIQKQGILEKKFHRIAIGVRGIPYAAIHNEGGTITITQKMRNYFWYMAMNAKSKDEKQYWTNMALHRGGTITIPKREYIGDSRVLTKKNEVIIRREMNKIFAK